MYCFLTHVIIPSGIGFKLAYKFTALIDIILQENFGTKGFQLSVTNKKDQILGDLSNDKCSYLGHF